MFDLRICVPKCGHKSSDANIIDFLNGRRVRSKTTTCTISMIRKNRIRKNVRKCQSGGSRMLPG